MTKPKQYLVSGKHFTLAELAQALNKTEASVRAKYKRVHDAYGKVTMTQMEHRFRDPQVAVRIADNLLQREIDDVVRDARMHGHAHAAMVYALDADDVIALVKREDRKGRSYMRGVKS